MKALPRLLQLKLLLLCACALACQTADELLGSACPHGVCAQATAAQDGLACVITQDYWEIAVQPDDELPKQCLPIPILSSASGQLPCRMGIRPLAPGVTLLALGVEQCADQPFLEAGSYSDPYDHERSVGGPFCFVRQLSAGQRGEGGEEGWFYSELDGCPRVELTAAAKSFALANEVNLQLICATASARNPEGGHSSVDPDLCGDSNTASTRDVGAACMPSIIPEEGFDPRRAYFEARSEQCQTGGCLVRLLDGDPSSDCAPPARCPPPGEIERTVYCSCRCDAPEGDPGPLCDCPADFSCVETFDLAPPGLRGGYCVRSNRVSE